jgi:hypothetical protein
METLLLYPLKASVVLLVFFAAYHLLLKKETFFTSNRAFLLAGLITSALLPLVEYTKVIWVDAKPMQTLTPAQIAYLATAMKQQAIQAPAEEPFNWWYVVASVYALGLAFFIIALFTDIFKIRKMLKGKAIVKQQPYKLVDSPAISSPFSFFNYIVYNSGVLAPQELESIISHEKVHSRQKHSLDMLLSQAYCILFWFNPIAWQYKKAIAQNLEFIADAEAMKQVADKTAYQKTMLRLAVQVQSTSIINHFYQSLIKKRIVMLNTKKSRRRNSWKYAAVLPLIAFFIMAFQVKTVAQEKEVAQKQDPKYDGDLKIQLEIDKNFGDDKDFIEKQKKLFASIGAELIISDIKKNSKGEITGIKVVVKGNGQEQTYSTESTDPIAPFIVAAEQKNGKLTGVSTYQGTKKKPKGAVTAYAYTEETDDDTAVPHPPTPPVAYATAITPQFGNVASGIAVSEDENGSAIALNITDKTQVYVNGKLQPKGAPVRIPAGQTINSMNVLKGKDAKSKYGRDAKDGAIEITTTKKARRGYGIDRDNAARGFSFNFIGDDGENSTFHIEGDFADMANLESLSELEQLDLSELRRFGDVRVEANINEGDIQALIDRAMSLADAAGRNADIAHRNAERSAIGRARAEERRADISPRREDLKASKEELRKELEQARKELEEARKELKKQTEKRRAEMNKKA